jgi:hypothetical protein
MAMSSKLQELRNRLAQQEQKKAFTPNSGGGVFYPFFNAEASPSLATALRYLPDGDPNNAWFWKEKHTVRLPFSGIKGQSSKPVTVTIPSMSQWDDLKSQDTIANEVRNMYTLAKESGDESIKKTASTYYRRVNYLFQGFVRESRITEETSPENPIRLFQLNKQIFNIIQSTVMNDPDIMEIPCDYQHGLDFRIIKTNKGQYADYGTSAFSRRESSLTEDELAAIDKYGLFNLSEFIGKKPNEQDIAVINEMFEASVDGAEYDVERWGNHYRPFGVNAPTSAKTTVAGSSESQHNAPEDTHNAADSAPVTHTPTFTVETPSTPATTSPKQSAQALLDLVRNRAHKQ